MALPFKFEEKFVKACREADLDVCQSSIAALQTRDALSDESIQQILGYAFSTAAARNHVAVMELLLYPTRNSPIMTQSTELHECLLYGMCRQEKYFPREPQFQCCYALRYLAYAAIMCVKHNALSALEFLIRKQTLPMTPLLVDTDVVRCFRLALELGSDCNAVAPEAYRPMLMLLLRRYPALLLPHVDGQHHTTDGSTNEHLKALQISLLYEYVTNPQTQTK